MSEENLSNSKTDFAANGDCRPVPCLLSDCPAGDHMARLPYFREEPLPVQVDVWTSLDGKHTERTVSLKRGSVSHRYLSDTELHGAEFFPANSQDREP
jgi:hypothetical protein